jgi:hypothetical protein
MVFLKSLDGGVVFYLISLCKMASSFSAGRKKGPFFFPPKKPLVNSAKNDNL